MTGQEVAYIRVSTIEQNTESQRAILSKIKIDKVFEEKIRTRQPLAFIMPDEGVVADSLLILQYIVEAFRMSILYIGWIHHFATTPSLA